MNKQCIDEQITSPKEESHTQRREIREEESGQTHTPERERERNPHTPLSLSCNRYTQYKNLIRENAREKGKEKEGEGPSITQALEDTDNLLYVWLLSRLHSKYSTSPLPSHYYSHSTIVCAVCM